MSKLIRFFDKLEDRVRGGLSHYPIIYATVAGFGVVLFWRGVWETSDLIGLHSVWSLVLGFLILLSTGILVAHFLGSKIIISGLKGDKKIEEKTLDEIEKEDSSLRKLHERMGRIEDLLNKK